MSGTRHGLPLGPQGLVKKRRQMDAPVDGESCALFRLGEQCNNKCPMCTNTGLRELHFFATEELVERAGFLHQRGFRRVVVTGGEPTIHPGFFTIVDTLHERGMSWDINTHGRTFARPDFAERTRRSGLRRAIVSLHSHEVAASCAMSGIRPDAHQETIAGIHALRAAGVDVTINCVISTYTVGKLRAFFDYCVARFGATPDSAGRDFARCTVKLAFPSLYAQTPDFAPIQLRYADVGAELRALRTHAATSAVALQFESVPSCILDDPGAVNTGRFGFGETHYLDDRTGDQLFSMEWAEAQSAVYPRACTSCPAFARCPGVSARYAQRHGTDELRPFASKLPWWHPG